MAEKIFQQKIITQSKLDKKTTYIQTKKLIEVALQATTKNYEY